MKSHCSSTACRTPKVVSSCYNFEKDTVVYRSLERRRDAYILKSYYSRHISTYSGRMLFTAHSHLSHAICHQRQYACGRAATVPLPRGNSCSGHPAHRSAPLLTRALASHAMPTLIRLTVAIMTIAARQSR